MPRYPLERLHVGMKRPEIDEVDEAAAADMPHRAVSGTWGIQRPMTSAEIGRILPRYPPERQHVGRKRPEIDEVGEATAANIPHRAVSGTWGIQRPMTLAEKAQIMPRYPLESQHVGRKRPEIDEVGETAAVK